MKIQLYYYKLFYKYPFKIAHTERAYTSALYLLVSYGEHTAWGEVVFPPYYPETVEKASTFFSKISLPKQIEELDIQSYTNNLCLEYPNDIFSISGLDIALLNLKGKVLKTSVNKLLKAPEGKKKTSFTLGISSREIMERKISENSEISYYKLKVNEEEIGRILEDYFSVTNKPFVVDANQGFSSFKKAAYWVKELALLKAAYIEQPFHKDDFENHKTLKEISEIPVIADESFQKNTPLDQIVKSFDGVNVKLMKAGGVSAANSIIDTVSVKGLKTVLGCMSESSLGINAANTLVSKVDWVDLDGHLLINNDPFLDSKNDIEVLEKLTKDI